MPFSAAQTSALVATLDRGRIAHRSQSGRQLSYLEGWDVIETANTIFGYGGWGYTVTSLEHTCGIWKAVVLTTVNAGGEPVMREDVGVGIPAIPTRKDREGNPLPKEQQPTEATPDAHETAIKGAVTDALKRALRGYGDQFGLSLYAKDGDDAKGRPAPPSPAPARPAQPAPPATAKPATETLSVDEQKPVWDRIRRYAADGGVDRDALNEYTKGYLHGTLGLEGWNLLARAQWADFERAAAVYCGQEPVQTPPASPTPPDGSWEATASPARETDAQPGQTQACANCGEPLVYKAGVKDGKEWKAWMCSAKCGAKPQWINDRQAR